ncbi:uncharacterized protein LOC114349383 [Diabrotica virgifera virgifera]|uniref:Leucine-rich repeat extensin-like protein 1 n=1 Tax=Diabrotica virgifera virgifera TaxID=50390 RepID=A0A6P7HA47_DIAVI|nr:uncharacterized protein LOC114349383 [Diabrotica virgifera virgifera]
MAYKIFLFSCLIAAGSAGSVQLQTSAPAVGPSPQIHITATPAVQYSAQVPHQGAVIIQQAPSLLQNAALILSQAAPILQAPQLIHQTPQLVHQAPQLVHPAPQLVQQAAPYIQQAAPYIQQSAPIYQQPAPVLQQHNPFLQYAVRIAVPTAQYAQNPPPPQPAIQYAPQEVQISQKQIQQESPVPILQYSAQLQAPTPFQITRNPVQIIAKAVPQFTPSVQYAEQDTGSVEDSDIVDQYDEPSPEALAPIVAAPEAPAPVHYAPIVKAAKVTKVKKPDHFDHNPEYSYGYDIEDGQTGDSKRQNEQRQGDVVQGSYSVVDPDGHKRTVEYTADPIHGFSAVVRREPVNIKSSRPVRRSRKYKTRE